MEKNGQMLPTESFTIWALRRHAPSVAPTPGSSSGRPPVLRRLITAPRQHPSQIASIVYHYALCIASPHPSHDTTPPARLSVSGEGL